MKKSMVFLTDFDAPCGPPFFAVAPHRRRRRSTAHHPGWRSWANVPGPGDPGDPLGQCS